jgi:hypothetical protein
VETPFFIDSLNLIVNCVGGGIIVLIVKLGGSMPNIPQHKILPTPSRLEDLNELRNALDNLRDAFFRMNSIVNGIHDINDFIVDPVNDGEVCEYPFAYSFDEVVCDVSSWTDAVTVTIQPLIEKLQDEEMER